MNMDGDMVGKKIRVYGPKEKQWFHATIKCTCKKRKAIRTSCPWSLSYTPPHRVQRRSRRVAKSAPAERQVPRVEIKVEPFTEDRFDF